MISASSKYISEVFIVVKFKKDIEIRYKQGKVEKAYNGLFNSQAIQTNIPDKEIPTQPRFIYNDKKKQLLISQETVQFTLNFDKSMLLNDQLNAIRKNASSFKSATDNFIDPPDLEQTGIVINVNYPSKESAEEMNRYLFNRFINSEHIGKNIGEVQSSICKFGFKTIDSFFVNYEISPYQLRDINPPNTLNELYIDINEYPVKETGYLILLDINNRPQIIDKKENVSTIDQIIDKFQNELFSDLDKLIGAGELS